MEPTQSLEGMPSQGSPSVESVQEAFPQLEILEWIGRGGMGCVFKARQPKLNRLVALKLLPASLADGDPAFANRFEREGQLLARLHHPSVVAVHDSGIAGAFFYLVMEYVDGVNLRQAMRASRFTPAQALAIVPHICEALQYAHDEGVLHRDIKPENILLDSKGRVKLADFGIAKLLADTEASAMPASGVGQGITLAGTAIGTPGYMAPEQREAPGGVDHRADIYSLGVVFYELLTGELPKEKFVPPSIRSGTDPRVDAIVAQALEKDPDRRQRNAEVVKTQVVSLQGPGPAPARPMVTALVVVLGVAFLCWVGATMYRAFGQAVAAPASPVTPTPTDTANVATPAVTVQRSAPGATATLTDTLSYRLQRLGHTDIFDIYESLAKGHPWVDHVSTEYSSVERVVKVAGPPNEAARMMNAIRAHDLMPAERKSRPAEDMLCKIVLAACSQEAAWLEGHASARMKGVLSEKQITFEALATMLVESAVLDLAGADIVGLNDTLTVFRMTMMGGAHSHLQIRLVRVKAPEGTWPWEFTIEEGLTFPAKSSPADIPR